MSTKLWLLGPSVVALLQTIPVLLSTTKPSSLLELSVQSNFTPSSTVVVVRVEGPTSIGRDPVVETVPVVTVVKPVVPAPVVWPIVPLVVEGLSQFEPVHGVLQLHELRSHSQCIVSGTDTCTSTVSQLDWASM